VLLTQHEFKIFHQEKQFFLAVWFDAIGIIEIALLDENII